MLLASSTTQQKVEHIQISQVFWNFIGHGGGVTCEATAARRLDWFHDFHEMTIAGATASSKLDWFLDFHKMTVAGATTSNKLDWFHDFHKMTVAGQQPVINLIGFLISMK